MAYPSAPWNLSGFALLTLHLLDVDRVKPLIPSDLSIVPVLPGKTLGSVYFSVYTKGSALEYSELIVAPAVLTRQGKIGSWVSHIYVNNEDSVAGGREIWGLPKEMAEFTWSNSAVRVYQAERELCSFSFQPTWLQL
ncbi:MAG TPA: acetoacetate decarboxylase family protein, partial [Leptolyngbyaceae cyanobacterium]